MRSSGGIYAFVLGASMILVASVPIPLRVFVLASAFALALLAPRPSHAAAAGEPAALASPAPAGVASTVEGTLEVLVEDHAKTARTRYLLHTRQGEAVELRSSRRMPSWTAGSRLRATGQRSGNVLYLSTSGQTSATVVASAPLPNSFGEQKVAVLLVNFSDNLAQPYSLAQATDLVFNQVGGFYKENSFGQTWLSGQTFGWFTLPVASTCDGTTIANYTKQAAAAAGIDLSPYPRLMYVFPRNLSCGWAGMANLGGTAPALWINGALTLSTVGHEMGHTFGLYHAHSMDCGTGSLGSSCTTYEYGDYIDIMANTMTGHVDAFGKERLGWLGSSGLPPITTVQTSGRYAIEAYAQAPAGVAKAIKVPRGLDPVSGAPSWYYVEYRQPVGYDAGLPSYNYLDGVIVRIATDGDGNSGQQLDMTPNSSSFDDWLDARLPFGQSYVDAAAGVTLTAVGGDGHNAQIDVTLASGSCTRAAPTVSLAGSAASASPGGTIGYTWSVKNNDSGNCGASNFALQIGVPSGWSASPANASQSIAPGATGSGSANVAAPSSAAGGSYSISATASNAGASAFTASANAPFTVTGGSTISTTVSTNQTSYAVGNTVAATAVVKAGGMAQAGASVSFVFVKPNGSTVLKSATTDGKGVANASYKIGRRDPTGSWTVRDSASFTGLTATASSSFAVQ